MDTKYMRYILLSILITVLCLVWQKPSRATDTYTPGFLASYSTAKGATCTRGSLGHSKVNIYVCWSTNSWKKATIN
jgi:hypothetical protein